MAGIFDSGIFDSGIFDGGALTVAVPAGVLTFTAPAPGTGNITVAVPAGLLTFTAPAPKTIATAHVSAGVLTFTAPAPTITERLVIHPPAGVLTLTGPTPSVHAGTVVAIPAGLLGLSSQVLVPLTVTPTGPNPVRLWLGGLEINPDRIGWDLKFEEIIGTGTAHLTLVDLSPLTSGFEPEPYEDVRCTLRDTGWVVFHGETGEINLELWENSESRIWSIECRDYNDHLSQRLVGAPDGYNWWRAWDQDPFQVIDPSAIASGTYKATAQRWFRAYFRFPNGSAATVGPHVEAGSLPTDIYLYNAMTDLRGALETMASAADVNLQGWLRPDDEFVLMAIPPWQDLIAGGSTGLLDPAPVDLGTGGTEIMSLKLTKSGPMPQQLYMRGQTTYTQDPDTTLVVAGGSGWYPSYLATTGIPQWRQAYAAAPKAFDETGRNLAGAIAYSRAQAPTLRMEVEVEGVDGWRVGQYVNVTDARLPPSLQDGSGTGTFVIQRVAGELYPGTNVRKYTLGLGDGPVSAIAQYSGSDPYAARNAAENAAQQKALTQPPTWTYLIEWDQPNIAVKSGQHRTFKARPGDTIGTYWDIAGVAVNFELHVYDADEVEVTGTSDAVLDATSTTANSDGSATGGFTADSSHSDYSYDVDAWIVLTSA